MIKLEDVIKKFENLNADESKEFKELLDNMTPIEKMKNKVKNMVRIYEFEGDPHKEFSEYAFKLIDALEFVMNFDSCRRPYFEMKINHILEDEK